MLILLNGKTLEPTTYLFFFSIFTLC